MRIGRTIPPAAAPIFPRDIFEGFKRLLRGDSEINNFQSDLQEYFKVRYCFLTSSGKAALTLILQALHHIYPDRNEVLIPAFTCYSVPSAIVRAGLKIRLCDINPETLDYDFEKLQNTLQDKQNLLAIVCQHLFGLPANMAKINGILDDPQISVIEDAAQAMGNVADNRHLGTLGGIGFFSLGRGKAFSTVEGGVIITNSDKIAESLRHRIKKIPVPSAATTSKLIAYALALSVLAQPSLFWIPKLIPGLKLGETIYDPQFPMNQFSQFQAGLARNWRKRITFFQSQRKQNLLFWEKMLSQFVWLKPLVKRDDLPGRSFPLLRLPVLVQNKSLRNDLLKISEKHGLGIMPTYPSTVDKIEELKFESNDKAFPGAKKCVERLLTFPVHPLISSKDRHKIIDQLRFVQKKHPHQNPFH